MADKIKAIEQESDEEKDRVAKKAYNDGLVAGKTAARYGEQDWLLRERVHWRHVPTRAFVCFSFSLPSAVDVHSQAHAVEAKRASDSHAAEVKNLKKQLEAAKQAQATATSSGDNAAIVKKVMSQLYFALREEFDESAEVCCYH
jgi:hypothetical protein